jgi:hypothetical protein
MWMHYIAERQEHTEQAFLATVKLRADGTPVTFSREDHDGMHLFERADRFLPHGWCTLPPLQTCDKGNDRPAITRTASPPVAANAADQPPAPAHHDADHRHQVGNFGEQLWPRSLRGHAHRLVRLETTGRRLAALSSVDAQHQGASLLSGVI